MKEEQRLPPGTSPAASLADGKLTAGLDAEPSAAFTPGPWVVQHDLVVSLATCDTICAVKRPCNGAWTVNVPAIEEANARLIAAAPDTRDALWRLANECDALAAFEDEIRAVIGNTNWNVLRGRVAAARAVLSKAEGRS